jgi:beta-lactamase regulating signal transducer with metallopeptidase domain
MTHIDLAAASLLGALSAAAIKVALLLTLVTVVTMGLRHRSAALKHLVWTIGLGATVAVLVLPAALPAWRIVPLPAVTFGAAHANVAAATSVSAAAAGSERDVELLDSLSASHPASRTAAGHGAPAAPARVLSDHWPSALIGLWLVVAIITLARYVWSTIALSRVCGRATMLADATGGALARDIASDLGISRAVSVLRSDEVELPLTWGSCTPAWCCLTTRRNGAPNASGTCSSMSSRT